MLNRQIQILTGCSILALIIVSYSILYLLDYDAAMAWGTEDGPVEWAGAAGLAIAGIVFARLAVKSTIDTRSRIWLALLALLFIFGAGEEISWGQRILGFETPEAVREANLQGEVNIHNLAIFHASDAEGDVKSGLARWLTTHRLFSLFWLGFCIVVPAAYHFIRPVRRLLERLGLPIVHLGLGLFFPLIYLIPELMLDGMARRGLDWPLIETKESLYSLLFAAIAIELALTARRSGSVQRPLASSPLSSLGEASKPIR